MNKVKVIASNTLLGVLLIVSVTTVALPQEKLGHYKEILGTVFSTLSFVEPTVE
ncbi:hypothetical protein [Microbulbifer sp. THAF38]|uniref:hypothetical protein n=1 Tax=Microbulbifer sp. THAF38 TaxID=2587856 RepID=UPI0015624F96|nr:hypothetical protein [Microbulbifer sp. THAF38]